MSANTLSESLATIMDKYEAIGLDNEDAILNGSLVGLNVAIDYDDGERFNEVRGRILVAGFDRTNMFLIVSDEVDGRTFVDLETVGVEAVEVSYRGIPLN